MNPLIRESRRYIEDLNWCLTVVVGSGAQSKRPFFKGWPDFRYDAAQLERLLTKYPNAGVGLNLGPSQLVDVEADTKEGGELLDELCSGIETPCWKSRRGKHRLFQLPDDFGKLEIKSLGIEFRTGRHQSVLPPSILGVDRVSYQWIIEPFGCLPLPLPDNLLALADEHRLDPRNVSESPPSRKERQAWPYRDNLDYILRQFDLLDIAVAAGLNVPIYFAPDINGNVPCHVPEQLRDGREDLHPSGVFNVHSGVLRDFSTGRNHLFLNVIAALSDRCWIDVFKELEQSAAPKQGRPHSRRISLPSNAPMEERISLDDARAALNRYYVKQLSRPHRPKTIHAIKGPPGIGKTYGICVELAVREKKAIILTQENKLASRHRDLLNDGGQIQARRMPILRETACPHPDQYEATVRRGFEASKSLPCRTCVIGPRNCPYLIDFGNLADGNQLCAAVTYHTHDGFYESYGNEHRSILVFDENAIDAWLEPVSHAMKAWAAWGDLFRQWAIETDVADDPAVSSVLKFIDWLQDCQKRFQDRIIARRGKVKFAPFTIPDELKHSEFDIPSAFSKWLMDVAFGERGGGIHNLSRHVAYLLTSEDTHIFLERFGGLDGSDNIRFRKRHPLPDDKEVFVLDATANEELLRAVVPDDWTIHVWDCPPVAQAGRVVQIMDYDISKNFIRRQIDRHESHNPCWLVQVLDQLLDQHSPAALISFKKALKDLPDPEFDILGALSHRDKISSLHNFPCRGHDFEEDTLIVLGTPYKDEAVCWELAMAIWGTEGLPATKYQHRDQPYGDFVSRNMGYGDARLKPIEEFLISAELAQAIGRVRPLQRDCTVFVLSNAPIPDWEVEQFMAAELFDLRRPLQKNGAESYRRFIGIVENLLANSIVVRPKDIYAAVPLSNRQAQRYLKRFKREHSERISLEGFNIRLDK